MSAIKLALCGVSIVLAFAAMVLSAMASSDANKGDMDKAKKYSTWSAVCSAVVALLLFVGLGMHFYYGGRRSMMA